MTDAECLMTAGIAIATVITLGCVAWKWIDEFGWYKKGEK